MPTKKPSQRPATQSQSSRGSAQSRKPWPRWMIGIGVVVAGLFVLGIGGFVAGTTLEENDSFCLTCHTVPEATYNDRASAAKLNASVPISDLATLHYHLTQTKGESFSCIGCHRGDSSLADRAKTLLLAARDSVTYLSGKANPAIEKPTIGEPVLVNTACVGCHEKTLLTANGEETHFHNLLPATTVLVASGKQMITSTGNGRVRRFETVKTSLTCTDCHITHKTVDNSDPGLKLVDVPLTQKACDLCHNIAGD